MYKQKMQRKPRRTVPTLSSMRTKGTFTFSRLDSSEHTPSVLSAGTQASSRKLQEQEMNESFYKQQEIFFKRENSG